MTPEEIMTNVANEHSYETWGEMMYDTYEHSQIEYTKEAMLNYAEQEVKNLQQTHVSRRSELLFAFIKEVKTEFADQNWDYLDFIAERVLSKQ